VNIKKFKKTAANVIYWTFVVARTLFWIGVIFAFVLVLCSLVYGAFHSIMADTETRKSFVIALKVLATVVEAAALLMMFIAIFEWAEKNRE
jgi:hypothetical protein